MRGVQFFGISSIIRRHSPGPAAREILIPPETYFDGYDNDRCLITANNSASISTAQFAARLRETQARPEVHAVFVRICEYADALEDPTCWIGSDSIYVVTRANLETVQSWFADFEPSDVSEEPRHAQFFPDPLRSIPEGHHLFAVWWD